MTRSLMAAARGVGGVADASRLEGTRAFNRARRYLKYPEKKYAVHGLCKVCVNKAGELCFHKYRLQEIAE